MKPVCTTLGILLIVVTAPLTHATAQQVGSAPENAALSYWQAFAVLPELSEQQDQILSRWDNVPLDDLAVELIDQSAMALGLLHRGATIERCYWGSALEEGPGTLLPHLSKARMLARFACLRARYRFQQGQMTEARQDVKDVLILSRHVGSEPLLISYLVCVAIERMAMSAVTAELPGLPKAELTGILADLQSLPPRATVGQGIEGERRWMLGWIRREVAKAAKNDGKERTKFMESLLGDDPASKQAARAFMQEPTAAIRMLDEIDAYYDQMTGLVELPAGQRSTGWNDIEQRIKDGENPWAGLLLPAIGNIFAVEQESEVRWAMLLAAIDIARDGPTRSQEHKDPAGHGPFQFRRLPTGFELRSELIYKDKPVVLIIGRDKKSDAETRRK